MTVVVNRKCGRKQPDHAMYRAWRDRTLIERRIRDADRRIDILVYDLYALTPADISLVEAL